MLGYKKSEDFRASRELDASDLPDSVNWVTKGAVTPVKDQGHCGSCWTFSITGALEGAEFVKNGDLKSLSEQQIVDCDIRNNGCGGGNMEWAFYYTEGNGIELDKDYPYTSGNGKVGSCKRDTSKPAIASRDITNVKPGNSTQLKAALAQ